MSSVGTPAGSSGQDVPGGTSRPTGASTARPGTTTGTPAASALSGVPAFSHVYLIVLENHGYDAIVNSGQAPYLRSLADGFGLATAYHAISHPSEPNYIALFSGSTQGVADDGVHELAAPSLADELAAQGRTWRVYAENVPPGCYRGAVASGGPDGPGTYARKHEPAISFISVSGDATRCAWIQPLGNLDPAAADFELIVPNMCHDMHDCDVRTGDDFLRGLVPRILDSRAWRDGGVLFITFDEGDGPAGAGDRVATLVVSPAVRSGLRSAVPHDHYDLLRTIQDAWGLGCVAETCRARPMSEFFAP